MKYCQKCLMPSTRPRIEFNGDICNACIAANKKKTNSVDYCEREKQFLELLRDIKSQQNSLYDCIVPWSGGKDSSAVALKLKTEYGLNPLLVTFNPLIPTEIGEHNRKKLLEFGFDSIYIETNKKVSSILSKRFLIERGNPKLHWDAGVNAAIFRIALQFGIKKIFFAEHGESNYGGKILNSQSERIRDYEEIFEHQIGDYPENWVDGAEVKEEDIILYSMPDERVINNAGIEAHYFGYYFPWNVVENYRYVSSVIDFKTHPQGRTCGTTTNFDSLDDYMDDVYYYMQYIKFGFGRAIRDLSRQIQFGEINRNEALKLAHLFDGEFPNKSLPNVLEFLKLSIDEFETIVNKHRSKAIWEYKNENWNHKFISDLV